MSTFEFTEGDTWGGHPVARKIVDAEPRQRLIATGIVLGAAIQDVGGSASACYTIDDGSGRVDLLFLGRRRVGDLDLGVCVTAEGTVMADHSRMVIWNPLYRVEPDTGALTWTRTLPPTGRPGPTKE